MDGLRASKLAEVCSVDLGRMGGPFAYRWEEDRRARPGGTEYKYVDTTAAEVEVCFDSPVRERGYPHSTKVCAMARHTCVVCRRR